MYLVDRQVLRQDQALCSKCFFTWRWSPEVIWNAERGPINVSVWVINEHGPSVVKTDTSVRGDMLSCFARKLWLDPRAISPVCPIATPTVIGCSERRYFLWIMLRSTTLSRRRTPTRPASSFSLFRKTQLSKWTVQQAGNAVLGSNNCSTVQ